ncbi:hypothetical protein VTK26DRAFT_5375 [Humicola hyalothermophila]
MLPGPLVSIYQQYKKDTDSVASWLASTARACGYPADLLTSGSWDATPPRSRPKGKSRKKAAKDSTKGSTKYVVALADFLPMAKFVSARMNPSVSVPETLSTTLNRLIALRSSFGRRMAAHGAAPDAESEAKHDYFVGVLEGVRVALRPRMSAASAASTTTSPPHDVPHALSNRFEALTVDEPSAAFLNEPNAEIPQPMVTDQTVYEAEPQTSLEDALFAMCVLVEDLRKIRISINRIWSGYGAGVFDLCAAAVATNTATELARGVIDEVLPVFKDHGGTWGVLNKFFIGSCLGKGFSLNELFTNGRSMFGNEDNFNYDTYKIADDLYMNAYRALLGFLDVLDPQDLPLMKEGIFGKYDATSDPLSKTGKERTDEDNILLSEFFAELMVVIRLVPTYPVEDEFLRGLREMDTTRQVPFYLVFTAQVFLDIHHTLRAKAASGSLRMIAETSLMGLELQKHVDFHKQLKIRNWSTPNEQALRALQKELDWIARDPVYQTKVRMMRRHGIPIAPTIQPHRILQYSPVLAGLMLFQFRFRTHQVGVAVANAWGSIQYAYHLHHALESQRLLKGPWLDMMVAHSLLGDASFFAGGPPSATSPSSSSSLLDDHFKKFCLQMGVTVTAFANPKQRRTGLASRAGPRGIRDDDVLLPVSSRFAARYLGRTGQMVWTAELVDEVVSRSEWEVEDSEEGQEKGMVVMRQMDESEAKEKRAAQRQRQQEGAAVAAGGRIATKEKGKTAVSTERLIESLVMALHAETMGMAFPYLTLHRSCWTLLREVKASCDAVLRVLFTPAYMEKETELPWVVGYIFMAAAQNGAAVPEVLRLLQNAAEAFNGWLGTGKHTEALAVLRKMGHHVEFEEED